MKKIKYLIAVVVFLMPVTTWAVFDSVTHDGGSQIYLTGTGKNYTVNGYTRVESYVINASSIDFSVSSGSIIYLSSADRSAFSYSSNTCKSITETCDTNSSSLFIECNNVSAQTITVTPSGTCSEVSGGSIVGGGGGGGGGGQVTTPATPTTDTTKKSTPVAATCPLDIGSAYKVGSSPAVYYVTSDCEKRPFSKSNVFFTYFDKWSDVKPVAKEKLDAMKNDTLGFMPWGPKYDPKYGALVKIVTDPKVYLLLGTEKYWITEETVFNGLGYAWNWIEDIDKALLDKYTTGSEISYTGHHPNYTLIKYDSSAKVYRLEPDSSDSSKQVKRHIKDEAAFKGLNFRWDRIVNVPTTEVYTDGAQLE